MQKKKIYHSLQSLFLILAGNTIYAVGIVFFLLPSGIITGGTTGLALVFQHFLHIPLNIFVTVFNIAMFLLGGWTLGKKFALTTLVSSFYYPLIFQLMTLFSSERVITSDPMLTTIIAGLLIGCGIGLVIRAGASTGGMDIPPLIVNRFTGLPISVGLTLFDGIILILQMFFSNQEQILYGILLVLIYTMTLDRVLLFGNSKLEVKIISPHYEEINLAIRQTLDRGVTLVYGAGGYTSLDTQIVLTVLSHRELVQLNRLVSDIDPNAFFIVAEVKEVRGRGFTLDKKYN